MDKFVSGTYRPEEDKSRVVRSLKTITELHSRENVRRGRENAKHNAWYYRARMSRNHRRSYDRMVGSE